MEQELEDMFDRADAFMIQDKKYEEAVSYYFVNVNIQIFSNIESDLRPNSPNGRSEHRRPQQLGQLPQAYLR